MNFTSVGEAFTPAKCIDTIQRDQSCEDGARAIKLSRCLLGMAG